MTISLHLLWWHIPALLSVLALYLAVFWPVDKGEEPSLTVFLRLLPATVFMCIVWGVAGAIK